MQLTVRTVRWSVHALIKLAEVRKYVAQDKPQAAARLALRITNSVNTLVTFPYSGREGGLAETREWTIPGTPYIATYSVGDSHMQILSIHHGMTEQGGAKG